MILLDTSGVLAALDSTQTHHHAAAECLRAATPPFLLSPFVLAELDYLVATRAGYAARRALLEEVERNAFLLEPMNTTDVGRAHAIIKRHHDLGISLADASIVVLAERHRTGDVLTLDERHFRSLTANRRPLRLLPADS